MKKAKKVYKKYQTYKQKKDELEAKDYIIPKTYKILGYCPECDMMLTEKDFVSQMVFQCPCGCKKHKKYLCLESKRDIRRQEISKIQYLKEAEEITKSYKVTVDSVDSIDLPDSEEHIEHIEHIEHTEYLDDSTISDHISE